MDTENVSKMTFEKRVNNMRRQHEGFTKLQQVFDSFLTHCVDFFDGEAGPKKLHQIKVRRPTDPGARAHFYVDYLGHSFEGRFAAKVKGETAVGRLTFYEASEEDPSAYIKKAECHFKEDGTVTDIPGYNEDGDPLQVAGDGRSNLFVIMSLSMKAVGGA